MGDWFLQGLCSITIYLNPWRITFIALDEPVEPAEQVDMSYGDGVSALFTDR